MCKLVSALNTCVRPQWANAWVTDASLRAEGGKYLNPDRPDHGNTAGSMLLLAMLAPETYGVPGTEPLIIFGSPPPETLMHIDKKRSRSGKGVDNRRTNAVEGLCFHFESTGDSRMHDLLEEAWGAVAWAWSVLDPFNKKIVAEMVRPMFAVSDDLTRAESCEQMLRERAELNLQWPDRGANQDEADIRWLEQKVPRWDFRARAPRCGVA